MQKYNVSLDRPLSELLIFNTVGLNDAVNRVLNKNGTPEDHTLVSRALINLPFDTLNYHQKNELLNIFKNLMLLLISHKHITYGVLQWIIKLNNSESLF